MSGDAQQKCVSPAKGASQELIQATLYDPVAAALADPVVLRRLCNTALATLRPWHERLTTVQRLEEANEVIQEAALRALERRAAYDPGRSVAPWLAGFVINVCKEKTRGRRTAHKTLATGGDNSLSLEEIVQDLGRPIVETIADRMDVRQMLDRLPANDRELLNLRCFDDLSTQEIGKQLGISDGAVRVRLHRVLTALRNEMTTKGEAQP